MNRYDTQSRYGRHSEFFKANLIIGNIKANLHDETGRKIENEQNIEAGIIAGFICREDLKKIIPNNDLFEFWMCDVIVIPKVKHKGGGQHEGNSFQDLMKNGLMPAMWDEHEKCEKT